MFGAIAAGLFHLRRTWAKPVIYRLKASGGAGRPLQLSNLMVVYALGATPSAIGEAEKDAEHGAHAGVSPFGDENAEMTIGDVADRLEIDPSTASRLVGHAISTGLVSRRPSPVDARRASLRLTEAGHRLRQVADRYRHRYLAELMADWSVEERSEFARLLTRFSEAASHRPMQLDGVDRIL